MTSGTGCVRDDGKVAVVGKEVEGKEGRKLAQYRGTLGGGGVVDEWSRDRMVGLKAR